MQNPGSAGIVEVFFQDRVGVANELLKQMDPQHHLRRNGGMPVFRRRMRRFQRQQFPPRNP
jgi:hypothetical protein